MILLTSTSDVLNLITSASCDVKVHASYVDLSGTTVTPGRRNTAITTATTTAIVTSPGSSTQRNVKTLAIHNDDATLSVTVTLVHTDGTTAVEIIKRTLKAGESLFYNDSTGFDDSPGGFFTSTGAALDLNETTTPGVPSAGVTRLFGRSLAGRMVPAFTGPSGLDTAVQPILARNKVGVWIPPGNATTVPGVTGLSALTATGTATGRNVATINIFTQMRRLGYVSAGTAGSSAGARLAVAQFWRGNFAGGGGFTFVARFGVSDAATIANSRMFVGMTANTGAFPNAEPSAQANIIGVGCNAGETSLSIMHNDGSGTATKIALGTDFPSQTTSTDMYEVAVFCPPNGSWVGVYVERLGTSFNQLQIITTDLPASTQLLAFQAWRNNGATALAVGIDIASFYIETDY